MQMKRMSRAKTAARLLAALLLTFLLSAGQASDPLRYQLQEGDLFPYRMTVSVKTAIELPGLGKMTPVNDTTVILTQRVLEIDQETGYGLIETKIVDLDASMSFGSAGLPGVSPEEIAAAEAQSNAMIRQQMKPLLGVSFKTEMTPRGEVKKAHTEELKEALSAVSGPAASTGAAPVPFLSEEALKQNILAPGLVFPKEAEEEWSSELEISAEPLGMIEMEMDWKRAGEEEVLKIPSRILEFAGTARLVGAPATQIMGVEAAFDLKSYDHEGVLHLSKEDGWPVLLTQTVAMEMSIEMSGFSPPAEEGALQSEAAEARADMRIEQKMKMERLTEKQFEELDKPSAE